jgi:hypothetical protein
MNTFLKLSFVGLLTACASFSQIALSGSSYMQNFDALGSGLPAGWSVSTSATINSLGTTATFTSAQTAWDATSAAFRNISSNDIAFGSNGAAQSANANRALGWRPVGSNAGEVAPFRTGAVTLEIENTLGFRDFKLSLDLFQSNNTSGVQTYVVEYRVGISGNFIQIGTSYTTSDLAANFVDFNVRQLTNISLAALDDQAEPVFIRVRGTTSSGSTNLDTIGLDNFVLTYSAVPEPSAFVAWSALAAFGWAGTRRRRRR